MGVFQVERERERHGKGKREDVVWMNGRSGYRERDAERNECGRLKQKIKKIG